MSPTPTLFRGFCLLLSTIINPRQVSHIMATAAQNGSCIVWDLKQKKPWCELKDPNRAPITDVAWNPDQGQHLVTGEQRKEGGGKIRRG